MFHLHKSFTQANKIQTHNRKIASNNRNNRKMCFFDQL